MSFILSILNVVKTEINKIFYFVEVIFSHIYHLINKMQTIAMAFHSYLYQSISLFPVFMIIIIIVIKLSSLFKFCKKFSNYQRIYFHLLWYKYNWLFIRLRKLIFLAAKSHYSVVIGASFCDCCLKIQNVPAC